MTDEQAKKLLGLLAQYLQDYENDGITEETTIGEVMDDLRRSL